MTAVQFKIVAVSVSVATGIALLAAEGSRSATVYYQTIPEALASGPSVAKNVRITGYVVPGSIQRQAGQPLVFQMQDAARTTRLTVRYGDLVPDTFKDRAEVVVEGRMDGSSFEASTLLAKCPSKYESKDGSART